MANKTPTTLVFMTMKDESAFSKALLSALPDVTFIDTGDWTTQHPVIRENLSACLNNSPQYSIWDSSILNISDYIEKYIFHDENQETYFGATIGPGLIQFIRSNPADYEKKCLRNGRLSSSYDAKEDPLTDLFVKTVFKIFKKGARKVYLVDRESGRLADKPETQFFAWPDAAEQYNGKEGKYLTNNALVYFVAAPK